MKWHDLRKDPNDLPEHAQIHGEIAVIVVTETADKRQFVDTNAYFLRGEFYTRDDDYGELLPIDHSPCYEDDEKIIAWTYYYNILYDFVGQERSDEK